MLNAILKNCEGDIKRIKVIGLIILLFFGLGLILEVNGTEYYETIKLKQSYFFSFTKFSEIRINNNIENKDNNYLISLYPFMNNQTYEVPKSSVEPEYGAGINVIVYNLNLSKTQDSYYYRINFMDVYPHDLRTERISTIISLNSQRIDNYIFYNTNNIDTLLNNMDNITETQLLTIFDEKKLPYLIFDNYSNSLPLVVPLEKEFYYSMMSNEETINNNINNLADRGKIIVSNNHLEHEYKGEMYKDGLIFYSNYNLTFSIETNEFRISVLNYYNTIVSYGVMNYLYNEVKVNYTDKRNNTNMTIYQYFGFDLWGLKASETINSNLQDTIFSHTPIITLNPKNGYFFLLIGLITISIFYRMKYKK